jgi:Peptidase family M1 domain
MIPILALLALQQPTAAGPTPYWQQRVVYEIDARLDEPTQTLAGHERLSYLNNSPDTLRTISFHLYLNAFRPGSRWSDADSVEQRRRFNDLKDPNYGFNHVRDVTIDGVAVQPAWPFGRDSTIVRFTLPHALPPGDSMVVTMNWDARTSIPPRRQGRRGRSYDFAQWYPKVVVYDKYGWEEHALYPAGEFYGEFGDFFVKLDLPNDQVVGATGVPVCGDPGWRGASRDTMHALLRGIDELAGMVYVGSGRSDFAPGCGVYGTSMGTNATAAPGRKELLWVARGVHNFAMSMSPDYRYEGGEVNGTLVHVLYQPGDEKTWGGGIVVNNTITTLKWLAFLFGPYPWPQMTVVHRIEGGGTEFPMMQMNGSPSLGLNLHEGGHTYLMGILANNEWKEGWMDEGFTSFQTTWYQETQARNDGAVRGLEVGILGADLDDQSQPVSTVSEKFRDFNTYNNMIYSRGELFLQELRRMLGDQMMLEILHRYFDRWKLHHVDEAAFRAVAEEVSHRDLTQFFAQWLHAVVLTDYAVKSAKREVTASGWRTTVNVERRAPGEFPVTVAVYAANDTAYVQADGTAESEQVVVTTRTKPHRVVLDPFTIAHDWNMLNNQYTFHWLPDWLRGREEPTHLYFDSYFSPQASRDHLVVGIMPTLWYNDAGGVTLGLHSRANYLGRFEENAMSEFCGVRHFGSTAHDLDSCGFSASVGNPTWWRIPNVSEHLNAFRFEGRAGASASIERVKADHIGFGPTHTFGGSLQWLATYDLSYLPSTLWDDGGSAEASVWWGVADTHGRWDLNFTAKAVGGVMYRSPGGGFTTTNRYDAQAYARPEVTATATRSLGKRTTLGLRAYGAAVFSADPVLSQRRIFVAGADPYQSMSNPFIRSIGAPLIREDCWCRWQVPGDGSLRGFNQSFSTDRLVAVNAELETTLLRPKTRLVSRVAVALFGDGAYTGATRGVGGIGDSTGLPVPDRWLADAGVGVRLTHRIGATTWTSRLDFPLFVSDAQWAFAQRQNRFAANRLIVAFSPVIR